MTKTKTKGRSRKSQKKKTKSAGKIQVDLFSTSGRKKGKTKLPEDVFAVSASPSLITQAVLSYRKNQRAGSAATKTRAQVKGSTRKIYRQKGTGRARHGAITAPIFRGGGISHGPSPRTYSAKLNKKAKRKALFACLTDKLQKEEILIISGFDNLEPKTKAMIKILKNLKLTDDRNKLAQKTLLILPKKEKTVTLAGRNIENLKIEEARLLNCYKVLRYEKIILTDSAVDSLASVFSTSGKKDSFELDKDKKSLSAKVEKKKDREIISQKKKEEDIKKETASSARPSRAG